MTPSRHTYQNCRLPKTKQLQKKDCLSRKDYYTESTVKTRRLHEKIIVNSEQMTCLLRTRANEDIFR